jgi:lipid-binding SYLF domain-containing protein
VTVDYYRTVSGSIGFQLGAQAKSIVIAFMTQESLDRFRGSAGWKVGADGSVALVDVGAGKTIDSTSIKDPVVGFVFGSRGLMYNLTLEGSKITKLDQP